MQKEKLHLFNDKSVRTIWSEEHEKWYFSVVDVVAVLTDSVNPTDYIKKMKQRDPILAKGWGQIVTPLLVQTSGGKQKTNFATSDGIFRIIQSIPSPKAEPFKVWMAQVAATRLDQLQDPELSIDQAVVDYKRLGYSDAWINQRIRSIEIRKELTDEWHSAYAVRHVDRHHHQGLEWLYNEAIQSIEKPEEGESSRPHDQLGIGTELVGGGFNDRTRPQTRTKRIFRKCDPGQERCQHRQDGSGEH